MSYNRGGLIQATDFNQVATLIKSVYGDTNSGSTAPGQRDFGYGATNTIPQKNIGDLITAADWTTVLGAITACGTHQGVSVSPIPSSVTTGQLIQAYNEYLTVKTLKDVVGTLVANRYSVATGQLATQTFTAQSSTGSWTTGRRYTFVIEFGTYNNARYFFNAGGSITIAGSYVKTPSPIPADTAWTDILTAMGTVKLEANNSSSVSSGQQTNLGYYDLSAVATTTYRRSLSPVYGPYSNNFVQISATASGSQVGISITLFDNDESVHPKTGNLTFTVGTIRSSGVIPYPGTVVYTPGTFSNVATTAFPGNLLNVTGNPPVISASRTGAGTVTANADVTVPAGTYTYNWQYLSGDTVTIASPTTKTTAINKSLSNGQIANGQLQCTVTGGGNTSILIVPWSFISNSTNI